MSEQGASAFSLSACFVVTNKGQQGPRAKGIAVTRAAKTARLAYKISPMHRESQTGSGAIPSLGRPPGEEDKREAQARERSDFANRLSRELYGKDLSQLSQAEMTQLNRTLERRDAQSKQRYEDELNNTRAVQDVRPQDYDRFYFRGTGSPVPGSMPYGPLKALQNDPDAASGVLHLSTDNAKTLSTLKLLEPVLKQYVSLIQYAYGTDPDTGQPGPLAQYTREPWPILQAMYDQYSQTDPVLQAKRRAVEGQLQSLVRALGSRGDLNAQELEQATNLIANMDASLGLGLTVGAGVGLGPRGIGPMVGFRPSISIPDTPAVGVRLANELIATVNERIGTLLQNPAYAGTPAVELPRVAPVPPPAPTRRRQSFGPPTQGRRLPSLVGP